MGFDRKQLGQLHYVRNENPHPAADLGYYITLVDYNGELIPLALTDMAIKTAMARAKKNPEDLTLLADSASDKSPNPS